MSLPVRLRVTLNLEIMIFVISLAKFIIFDGLRSIFYFPVWWYTRGLKKRFSGFIQGIKMSAHNLALKIMFKYLFKPMFGERSKSGRIISFFMRLILLFWRLFLFGLSLTGHLLLLIFWLVLPMMAVWQIIVLIG